MKQCANPEQLLRRGSCGSGLAAECGGVGWAIFVVGRFFLFDWFGWRNDPAKAVIFAEGGLDEGRVSREDGQDGAQEIGSVLGDRFVGLAAFDEFAKFGEACFGGANFGDAGIALLEQTEKRDAGKIVREANFHEGAGFVFFRGIELGETRAENVGLQVVFFGTGLGLLDTIFEGPNFRAVALGGVADQDNKKNGLVGLEIDFVVKLGNDGTKFFEEADTDLLEVAFGGIRLMVAGIGGVNVLGIAVETNGLGRSGKLPFGSTEKDGDMATIDLGDARRNGSGFEGMIDGAEDDGVARDLNEDATTGEVGDNFVLLRTGRCGEGK
jgi:hypothetical protein